MALALLGSIAFSGKAIIVKLAYRYGVDAVTLIMYRMLFALPIFAAMAWWASRGKPPLSRKERAENVKKRNYFAKYQGAARQVLEALLDKYADTGLTNIEDIKILQLDPFSKIGAPMELVKAFGGKAGYTQAVVELEKSLYA